MSYVQQPDNTSNATVPADQLSKHSTLMHMCYKTVYNSPVHFFFGFAVFGLAVFAFFGDLATFDFLAVLGLATLALVGDFAFFAAFGFFAAPEAAGFLAFFGEPAAFVFLAAFGFLATFVSAFFSPRLKLPDAPLPLDCLSVPFLTPARRASFRCTLTARSSWPSL